MVELLYIFKLLLFVPPAANFVAALIIYRLLCFLEHSYVVSSVALKGLKEEYYDLFLTFKCFFVLFGFSAVLLLVSLYFYTSAFPAIVSFLRTPLFWLGKAALLVRLLDKLVVYREVKRLDSPITARGYLFAGGPLVLFSGKGSAGVQTLLTTPTQFGVVSDIERSMLRNRTRSLADRHGNVAAELSNISPRSGDIKGIKASLEAANTHFGVALHYPDSNYMFTFGATSDGSRVPGIFYGYDAHLRKTFEGKTEFVNINNRVLAGFSEKGQSIITNAVQLREFNASDVVPINALDSRLRRLLNLGLFGEELSGLLGCLELKNRAVFEAINSSTSERDLLATLSEINRSNGIINIVDLRAVAGKLPNCISILTGSLL